MESEQIYFNCPNCKKSYDFNQFHNLEHMSQASPGDGRETLGHAKCGNCFNDFYYYLTSDAVPIIVKNDPPLDIVSPLYDLPDMVGATENKSAWKASPKSVDTEQDDVPSDEAGFDKMAQFERSLNNIDKALPPPERFKRISEALDLIIAEQPPQIEAGFDLLVEKFGLNARKIEAFRKEVNQKREQLETDKTMAQINAVFGKPPKKLSEDEQKDALGYLRDPDLFNNISRDIAVAGEVVGEEANKMMLYLAVTSRKFKNPISLVIFGKSSSGKSYLANAITQFLPEEDVLDLSSVSPKALEYARDDQLKHKCLLIQEWEGTEEAQNTIRVLQSEGKLSRFVTAIDPITKARVSRSNKVECPCCVIVTTTKEGIHDENSTRIFELYADESVEQTQRVVRHTLNNADMTKRIDPEEKNRILKLHRNVQRMLKSLDVNVPYASYLTFPGDTTRHRRDAFRFVNLIKAVAFLRQKQKEIRTINGIECVDADMDDYQIAFDIGRDILRATLNTISDRVKNALTVCCELNDRMIDSGKDPWFSVSEIQKTATELGLDFKNRKDLNKQLDILEEYEYVERKQPGKKAMRHYRVLFSYERNDTGEIINIDSPDIKKILTPEELRNRQQFDQRHLDAGSDLIESEVEMVKVS